MGFDNPPVRWSELEAKLSRRPMPADDRPRTHKRAPFRADPAAAPAGPVVPYAELHAHSAYSFLDGASMPEEMATEAHRLGLHALALTDHDGLYGAVRMAEAAQAYGDLRTVFGAELSIGRQGRTGMPDPEDDHLLLLARRQEGYRRLSLALTEGYLREGAEKGRPVHDLQDLAQRSGEQWMVLTGCRKGRVRRALVESGERAAYREIGELVDLFGKHNVLVELTDLGLPTDSTHNDQLARLAERHRLPVVATSAAHHATPQSHRLASALAAVRARSSLAELDGWLPPGAHLRSGAEMAHRFSRYPGATERTVEIADDLEFVLRTARPHLPDTEVPEGHSPMSWLRELVEQRMPQVYPEAVGNPDHEASRRIAEELAVISDKGFAGYFLIVHDLVSFARERGILCQGRGSAAASAVCYVLGITVIDSVFYRLPFERFLSALREEEPDIDVDFDSRRREEVIQYVYRRYGRRNAAQVSNVITYRPKNAIRDMAKALGYSTGQQDAWSKQIERWGSDFASTDHDIPPPVVELAQQLLKFPRHLGIHSGGMVLTDRPVSEVCPVEPARMENRTVLQWDKDDCAWMGLVKFDLLGLGMLAALQHTFDLVAAHLDERWRIETLPRNEPGVYDMLCRADAIGIFQVESRAQLGTLPRLRPRSFYDLAIEIALIRPGPIQGGAVHPYIRRRTGQDPVTYAHPLLEPVLERTLGIPLFQEQLIQMATTVGGCSMADADLLRRAMGSKRGVERIDELRAKLFEGMAANGITGELADSIYTQIEAFANFGFAESHSLSFAVLVYASSWLKLHYPAAFLAGLLRSQPMGFYSPATLTGDARRHGVRVLGPDLAVSGAQAGLEPIGGEAIGGGMADCLRDHTQAEVGQFDPDAPDRTDRHRRDHGLAVRLGLAEINLIGTDLAERIVAEREAGGAFVSIAELARRVGLDAAQLEALSLAGAFDSVAGSRRQALWQSGLVAGTGPGQLEVDLPSQPPLLPEPTPLELLGHDLRATGISPADHPMRHYRAEVAAAGVLPIEAMSEVEPGRRVLVAGVVTHRQRPMTAGGITFLNIEDETGLLNVIVTQGCWRKHRKVARTASAMIIRGILERSEHGVTNLYADQLVELVLRAATRSRDFQ
ncbi:error-prone DNA polymerase [Naumannella halotolerans]|uniref:Error-prone DNA polymerase n=1 Tax=Naumannella halotolerans TaxID=993414 RepID=A0A4R7J954_9ACTN|nr:error-prone DNA polymerase [Naumannella halotolerans]TDT33855.1 error-prone DNA polymerase [Naumannella halotolerans]